MPFPRAYGYVTPLARRYGYGYALRGNGVSPSPVLARRRRRRRPGPAAGAENFEPPQPIWRLHLHLGAPGRATATASALARAYGYVSTSGESYATHSLLVLGSYPLNRYERLNWWSAPWDGVWRYLRNWEVKGRMCAPLGRVNKRSVPKKKDMSRQYGVFWPSGANFR